MDSIMNKELINFDENDINLWINRYMGSEDFVEEDSDGEGDDINSIEDSIKSKFNLIIKIIKYCDSIVKTNKNDKIKGVKKFDEEMRHYCNNINDTLEYFDASHYNSSLSEQLDKLLNALFSAMNNKYRLHIDRILNCKSIVKCVDKFMRKIFKDIMNSIEIKEKEATQDAIDQYETKLQGEHLFLFSRLPFSEETGFSDDDDEFDYQYML